MKQMIYFVIILILSSGCSSNQQHNNLDNQSNFIYDNYDNQPSFVAESYVDSSDKITLLYSSSVIGKYSMEAANTAIAYLITNNKSFELNIIDMKDESLQSYNEALEQLDDSGIDNVVAVITNSSYENLILADDVSDFNIFLPLIHKNNVSKVLENIIYGGVDYKRQLETLTNYSPIQNIELYDNSLFGQTLHDVLLDVNPSILLAKEVNDVSGKYASYLNENLKTMSDFGIYLNTPVVKSSILLSQFTANDINVSRILSTQINYTPLILSLTQTTDRENLLIANSISEVPIQLKENVYNLGANITYDWLTYSTVVGLDYFASNEKKLEPNIILNQQVIYDIKLYRVKEHSFTQVQELDYLR